jgi:hypothetical protein
VPFDPPPLGGGDGSYVAPTQVRSLTRNETRDFAEKRHKGPEGRSFERSVLAGPSLAVSTGSEMAKRAYLHCLRFRH